jgi:hypothetical protein
MGAKRNEYRILVGKSERKGPLGRSRRRWEEFLKWIMREIVLVWGEVDWIDLAQDRDKLRAVVKAVMDLRVL